MGDSLCVPKHEPVAQRKVFLGLAKNSLTMKFEVPNSKITKFLEVLELVKSQAVLPVRLLAPFLGLLNSFSKALGQVLDL